MKPVTPAVLPCAAAALMCCMSLASLPAVAQGTARSTLTLLDLPAGWRFLSPTGMNDAGLVVGTAQELNSPLLRGFVWSAADGVRAVTPAGTTGMGNAVNNAGLAVGMGVDGADTRGWTWRAGQASASWVPGVDSWVAGTNDLGHLSGLAWNGTEWQAAVWRGPTAQTLGFVGMAHDINQLGQAVGGPQSASAPQNAFLWQDSTGRIDLGRLGGSSSTAYAINDRSQVVGSSTTAAGLSRAFLWQADTGMQELGTLRGGRTSASAINESGQAVGSDRLADGSSPRAVLWSRNGDTRDLAALAGAGFQAEGATGINGHAQVTGTGRAAAANAATIGFVLTLHPDWAGGDGSWDDSTGQRWNWAGTGTAAAKVGAMHDVVIDPGRSATVTGAAEGRARSLQIGGTVGTVVTLNLAGGTTTLGDGDAGIAYPSQVRRGGVLAGSGRLIVGETLDVRAGGRIDVAAGESMQIAADSLGNQGRVRVVGNALDTARLETSGNRYHFTNAGEGEVLVQHGELLLSGGLQNFGRVSVLSGRLLASDTVLNHAGGHLAFGFGQSLVDAVIDNRGLLVVSNGAEVSFHGQLQNRGELRVSAGGAANFFSDVQFDATGSLTGDGEIRFEGDLTVEGGPTITALSVGPHTTLAGAVLTFDRDGEGFAAGDLIDLFDWNGGVSGSFSTVNLPALGAGLAWNTADLYGGGTLRVTAVPEPQAWALFGSGFGLLSWLARRRRPAGLAA